MRTRPATRYNAQAEHNSYGIYNWFKGKGIVQNEIISEVVYAFCEKFGFKGLTAKTPERTMVNFAGNRFQKFHPFAMIYLKENNYL